MESRDFASISFFSFLGVLLRIGLGNGISEKVFKSNIFGVDIRLNSIPIELQPIYFDFFANFFGCIFMGALIQFAKEYASFKAKFVIQCGVFMTYFQGTRLFISVLLQAFWEV